MGRAKPFQQTVPTFSPLAVNRCGLTPNRSASRYVNGSVLTVDGGWTAGYTREF
jgi:NAD(P)-dependent dehydrogenase (short-subunit alcohol dehydrogenase family)